tara:strand:+ start:1377 stop:4310 length:2934 start_codon:yes stop_codon:yes gene_type:complete
MQFRTKARAVDLLGKGQIADLPTAISELWKNGYDAYADNLNLTFYTKGYEDVDSNFVVLSDDGKGMNESDIQDKWLILGTDSKSRGNKLIEGPDTLWKQPRPIMGEKGIGRLSVSYLGSPILMLSKKIGYPLQAMFFDWRILENYNLFLEDVTIPITQIDSINTFESKFNSLKNEFLSNFFDDKEKRQIEINKQWVDQPLLRENIIKDINNIQLNNFFDDEIVSEMIGDSDKNHGTKFIIFNPNEQFALVKKWSNQQNNSDDQDIETVNEIRAGLIGFYNEFKFKPVNSPVNTSFIIKDKTGERDFISSNSFFSNDDFSNSDHLIEGSFDEFGTFTGTIRIYDQIVDDYVYRPNVPADLKTAYGKFDIKLGYITGKQDSSLEANVFKYFEEKLSSFGGLYIYRDDLRVLPYGRARTDFLNFEERRTRSAGGYFFSYRRMFGYIDLNRINNGALRDKAGREGFINNKAFRDFRVHLEGLFLDLAKEYFGTNAKKNIKQSQLKKLKLAKASSREEEAKEKEERKQFKEVIKEIPKKLEIISIELERLYKILESKLSDSEIIYQDIESTLRELEKQQTLFNSLEPKLPKRFILNSREKVVFENIEDSYLLYQSKYRKLDQIREAALKKIEEKQLLNEYKNKFQNYIELFNVVTQSSKINLEQAFASIGNEFSKTENEFKSQLKQVYQDNIPKPPSRENLEDSLKTLQSSFGVIRNEYQNVLDAKSDHLLRLNFEVDDDALVGYYKDRYESTLEELGDFKNLAQLGISVEIINHELNAMYSQLNTSIATIDNHLKSTNEAEKHYKYLKNAFEHLNTKYQSLNPLYRRSRRTKKQIKGKEIEDYLLNFFSESFKEESIVFISTDAFKNSSIYTFESVILPTYINIINNAIYWLRSVNNPQIILDYDSKNDYLIIANNGPTIKESALEEIFNIFYTRRPKGRGLGLYLSKDNLESVGLDLWATNDNKYNLLNGASFIIGNKNN